MAEITFIGHIGKDSKIQFDQNGSPRLSFSVCDTKSKRLQDGSWEKLREQWFNCTLWGTDAEYFADRLLSGDKVKVHGEFYTRDYDRGNGPEKSMDVTVTGVSIIKKNEKNKQRQQGGNQPFDAVQHNRQSTPTQPVWEQPPTEPQGWDAAPPF
ncbi:single-stranded DNA-binding protein [Arthrobacter sp. RCC_34]|uniref:single-stranded DNA-binding protein n=1 Tax=Arthrobacter sp. RCC_34 TaxID=3239230 RepID=UPI0035248FD6